MVVCIAEKPSVAREIAQILGADSGYNADSHLPVESKRLQYRFHGLADITDE